MTKLPLVQLNELDALSSQNGRSADDGQHLRGQLAPARRRRQWRGLRSLAALGLVVNLLVAVFGLSLIHSKDPEVERISEWLTSRLPSLANLEAGSFWALAVASAAASFVPRQRSGTFVRAAIALPGIVLCLAAVLLLLTHFVRGVPHLLRAVAEGFGGLL